MKLKNFILGFIIIGALGTLGHFAYALSGKNTVLGYFTPVNESTWEHMKICLTPTFIWSLVDGYIYGMEANYFLAKFGSFMAIIILIPLLFYGYKFIFKKHNHITNVLIFFISIICSQFLFSYLISIEPINYFLKYQKRLANFEKN